MLEAEAEKELETMASIVGLTPSQAIRSDSVANNNNNESPPGVSHDGTNIVLSNYNNEFFVIHMEIVNGQIKLKKTMSHFMLRNAILTYFLRENVLVSVEYYNE